MRWMRWTEKLVGHERMRKLTTSSGNVWCVSADGRQAWPLLGPATKFGPYDSDVARGLGHEVNANLPPTSYVVTNAGDDWREVYSMLRSGDG